MGREILAMILNHFKTPRARSTIFTMEHIVKMQYFGGAQLDQFYHKWTEMCTNMLPEDVPPDNWPRDCLYKKIRNSHLLMFDIKQYESWDEGDYGTTYRHLRNVIERAIARAKEDKHSAVRDKYARDYAGSGKPTTPAPATPTPKAGQDATPAPKAKEKPKAKPRRRLMLHLPFLHHNRSSMLRGKVKGREHQGAAVDRITKPKGQEEDSLPISILSRSHARKEKIVISVMTRKYLTIIRRMAKGKVRANPQEEPYPTLQRR